MCGQSGTFMAFTTLHGCWRQNRYFGWLPQNKHFEKWRKLMTRSNGAYTYLNKQQTINFLRVLFREINDATARRGFSGVRKPLALALSELKKVSPINHSV